jgi:hypothetical protein
MNKKAWCFAVAFAVVGAQMGSAFADNGKHNGNGAAFTYSIYGDAPYGTTQGDTAELAATPHFVSAVNNDQTSEAIIHVGDIHSGQQWCTSDYDSDVYKVWQGGTLKQTAPDGRQITSPGFSKPLVYTPGDNEWSDCHKVKVNSAGAVTGGEGGGLYQPSTGQIKYVDSTNTLRYQSDPAFAGYADYAGGDGNANLALVRSIFFANPGHTLGSGTLAVTSQANTSDAGHPSDAQFAENVMWEKHGIVFVTINVPGGSNDNADPEYGAPLTSAQANERVVRQGADLRWLDAAFRLAHADDAAGLVIATQADMWDISGGGDPNHLSNYKPYVDSIAAHTTAFGHPVLLLNGDSHVYRSDNPLVPGAPCAGDAGTCASYDSYNAQPNGYNVPNFHRIVVHGSTFPLEYLNLTMSPSAHNATTDTASGGTFGNFSWTRVTE